MTEKVSTTDIRDLTPIQVQERGVAKHAFLRLPYRKRMGKYLIGCKCCAKHLGQGVLQTSQISRSCAIVFMRY